MDSLSTILSEFHFIRPWWLVGLLVPVVIALIYRNKPAHHTVDDLVDAHLRSAVVDYPEQQPSTDTRYFPALLFSLLILALAGPTWERLPQPLYQAQQGRVVVLSLAKSMDRKDLQPSRLQRAKFKIDDLLVSMPGVLTGLVAYAGEAFIVTPLSDDQDTISNLLQSLDTETLPVQGIRTERGLEKAKQLLAQVNIDSGEIILVTDQASPLAVSTARALSNDDIQVSVLEIAPLTDRSQSALLASIAQSGRGTHVRLTPDNEDVNQLNAPLKTWLRKSQGASSKTQRNADQWRDVGPWLLVPVLLLASLMFRRGWLLSLCLFGFLSVPQPVYAFDWSSLWKRTDQQQWSAIQAYRTGDMQTALQGFTKDRTAVGAYNTGNALANSVQLEAALNAYDEALKLRPDFADALYNRQIVEAALTQQQQDKQQSKPGEPQDDAQQGEKNQPPEQKKPGQQDQQKLKPNSDEGENKRDTNSENDSSSPQNNDETDVNQSNQNKTDQTPEVQTQVSNQKPPDSDEKQSALGQSSELMDEDAQALELLLRQVPDDPGSLLRRKFKYQYQNQKP